MKTKRHQSKAKRLARRSVAHKLRATGWKKVWVLTNPGYHLAGNGIRYPSQDHLEAMVRHTAQKYPDRVSIVERILGIHGIGYLKHEERQLLSLLCKVALSRSEEYDVIESGRKQAQTLAH